MTKYKIVKLIAQKMAVLHYEGEKELLADSILKTLHKESKQNAIEFVKYLSEKYNYDEDSECWYPKILYGYDEMHQAPEQIYDLFIKHKEERK